MPQESGRPLWETDRALFDKLVEQAREYYGNSGLGDEVVSQIADKFSLYTPPVDNPAGWVKTTAWSQRQEIKRKEARDKRPGGHFKKPLTERRTSKDGQPIEVEIRELADDRFSPTLSERGEELRRFKHTHFAELLETYGPLAIGDRGDKHRGLNEALLTNIIAEFMGQLQDRKDLATLRKEYGIPNVNYHKGMLLAAIARRLEDAGLNREALVHLLEELDPSDFYNVIDDTKMTPPANDCDGE
jgi:hypothetical protein